MTPKSRTNTRPKLTGAAILLLLMAGCNSGEPAPPAGTGAFTCHRQADPPRLARPAGGDQERHHHADHHQTHSARGAPCRSGENPVRREDRHPARINASRASASLGSEAWEPAGQPPPANSIRPAEDEPIGSARHRHGAGESRETQARLGLDLSFGLSRFLGARRDRHDRVQPSGRHADAHLCQRQVELVDPQARHRLIRCNRRCHGRSLDLGLLLFCGCRGLLCPRSLCFRRCGCRGWLSADVFDERARSNLLHALHAGRGVRVLLSQTLPQPGGRRRARAKQGRTRGLEHDRLCLGRDRLGA